MLVFAPELVCEFQLFYLSSYIENPENPPHRRRKIFTDLSTFVGRIFCLHQLKTGYTSFAGNPALVTSRDNDLYKKTTCFWWQFTRALFIKRNRWKSFLELLYFLLTTIIVLLLRFSLTAQNAYQSNLHAASRGSALFTT